MRGRKWSVSWWWWFCWRICKFAPKGTTMLVYLFIRSNNLLILLFKKDTFLRRTLIPMEEESKTKLNFSFTCKWSSNFKIKELSHRVSTAFVDMRNPCKTWNDLQSTNRSFVFIVRWQHRVWEQKIVYILYLQFQLDVITTTTISNESSKCRVFVCSKFFFHVFIIALNRIESCWNNSLLSKNCKANCAQHHIKVYRHIVNT